ncbi:MAG: NlpC/P60 family protein [Breznakibacter sp.]
MATSLKNKIGLVLPLLFSTMLAVAQPVSFRSICLDLQTLQKHLVPDKREAILHIELGDTLSPKVVVKGETDLPGAKSAIIRLLTEKGIAVVDSIRLLPDISLGEKVWALASLSVSNLRALPDHAAELVSQELMGTPLKVLDVEDNWYHVQTPENYIGWMDAGGLQLIDANELYRWKKAERYVFYELYGQVLDSPRRGADVVCDLVLGDLVETETSIGGFLKVKLPDGRIGYVRKKQCLSWDAWVRAQPNAESLLFIARQMMGMPYLWGGTSCKAADCSGFVKTVFFSQSIIVARDASQQARYGENIALGHMTGLKPGDLLFFGASDKRITHVGIYLEDSYFIHASGRVHIGSLDPGNPEYVDTRHHVSTRRILNSVGSEGIVRVKDHPWYAVQP